MKKFNFYTMLYVDLKNRSLSVNGMSGAFDKQMETFIKCCEALDKSLQFFTNHNLIVLTNNKEYVNDRSTNLNCIEIDFELEFPKGIKFFASHQKLSTFKYFADKKEDEYAFLIDNDIICINEMPVNLCRCIDNNIPVYYDVTNHHYPAYSRQAIVESKDLLMGKDESIGFWAGGEFIGGDNSFYDSLYNEIKSMHDHYLEVYKDMYHVGSEALASVAIEKIMKERYVCDAGIFGGIGRYWSNATKHAQKPWKSYEDNFLLHIPLDKGFISNLKQIDNTIKKRYKGYLMRVLPLKYAKNFAKKLTTKANTLLDLIAI